MSAPLGQLALSVLTVLGLFILSRYPGARAQLAGWALMFAAQPFWIAATWRAEQYGMLLVSLVYTVIAADALLCRLLLWIRTPRARR